MSPSTPVYAILARVQVNRWDVPLQRTVTGWDVTAQWAATGTILHVFVPDDRYTPDQVDALIRAAGAKDDAMESLGR